VKERTHRGPTPISRSVVAISGRRSAEEETTFVEVTLWGRTAEIAGEYLSKSRPCLIEGRLQLDQWEDKATGKKRSKLKVVGDTLQLLGNRGEGKDRESEPQD
jgi:single stranded DNA-binding protein